MKKKFFLFLIIFVSTLNTVTAQSTTTMTLEGVNPDVFYVQEVSSSQNVLTGTLTITRTNTSNEEFFVVDLSPVSTARQSWVFNYTEGYQTVAQANIYTTNKVSQAKYIAKTWGIEQNTTSNNFWIGSLEVGQSQTQIKYYLKFQQYTKPYPPAGVYQLDLEFRLWAARYSDYGQNPPSSITPYIRPITLSVLNEAYIYITFADENSLPINTIALDETSDKTIEFKLLTKSNYWRYDVTVTSINGGTLNLNTGTSIEKIPYHLWVVDMTTPINFTLTPIKTVLINHPIETFQTPPSEHDAKIQVLFDDTANYTAGRYSDILRLEIKRH
jgi:hypothetical protein